jgi:hypothetical protein
VSAAPAGAGWFHRAYSGQKVLGPGADGKPFGLLAAPACALAQDAGLSETSGNRENMGEHHEHGHHGQHAAPVRRRTLRVSDRDIAGLVLCGEMYGAPYDLLAVCLDVRPDRLGGIVARWRDAGYAETGRLGPGPAWCWLTRAGLATTGLRFAPGRPSLGRLAHLGAVLAARLALEFSSAGQVGQPWWRSERRIRAAAGGRVGGGHIPDAEADWPEVSGSPYPGNGGPSR